MRSGKRRKVKADYYCQSVIIFLNRHCMIGCPSCNVKAKTDYNNQISPQWLSSFFNKLEHLNFPGYLLWTGGEPFLSFDALQKGVELAAGLGYHSEILTSGDWFDLHPEFLESFSGYKNLSLRISLDNEHQSKIPLPLIIALIEKASQLKIDIKFTLREIPDSKISVNHSIEIIKKKLPDFYSANVQNPRWIHKIPHMTISQNKIKFGPTNRRSNQQSIIRKQFQKKGCKMVCRDLVIGEDGLIYPCCGFFSSPLLEHISGGDPLKETFQKLEINRQKIPLLRILKEEGPGGLCEILNLEPVNFELSFSKNLCSLCNAIFNHLGEEILRKLKLI